MLPDRISNPGPLTYESGALPIALRGPAPMSSFRNKMQEKDIQYSRTDTNRSSKPKGKEDSVEIGADRSLQYVDND